jgi:2-dehydro-3-deoxyphosphogluconate aldolase / (4S)-4-hydroxy-2-oxoglutarate aldolase
MTEVLDAIARQRVVPVLRSADPVDAVATARACAAAGMNVVELTRTTPRVEDAIAALRDDGLVLGLGTVTAAQHVEAAAAAGAAFVVSFASPEWLLPAARCAGVAAIPGAFTPTEILRCVESGADGVKLFPARFLSPAYLGDLRAVMPGLRAIPTGGIAARGHAIGAWLEAGALAVGVGSDLGTVAADGAAAVESRARAARGHALGEAA